MEAVVTAPIRSNTYTLEEYFELETAASSKHTFIDGAIFPMPGGTYTHNLVASNIVRIVGNAVATLDQSYHVLNSDMKVMIEAYNMVLYPDALVICGAPSFYRNREDIITNPLVIVEVLSPSTEGYDRGDTFDRYATLESFQEYILVHPVKKEVTSWFREEATLWRRTTTSLAAETLQMRALNTALSLREMFRGIA